MGRRFRSRNPHKGRRKRIVLIMLAVMLLSSLQTFIYVDRHLKPPLMNLAKVRVKQMAAEAINSSISERLANTADTSKLIEWQRDQSGNVTSFVLNYAEHMRIAAQTKDTVEATLHKLNSVPDYVPLGQALGSSILSSFGPHIPVKLVPEGSAQINLGTRYQNAGINMVLVEVYIRVVAELSVIIPFDTEPEVVESEIPITYVLVVGGTPMYYMDNKGNPVGNSASLPPSISLPQLPLQPAGGAVEGAQSSVLPAAGQGKEGSTKK